jgi:Zn-dependent protease
MPDSFPLSEETQSVLRYAAQLAQDFQHPAVFTEHILLSIIAYRSYQACQLLTALEVTLEELGQQCQLSIAKRSAVLQPLVNPQRPVSPSVEQALNAGIQSARAEQKACLETGFLLLGLLKPGLDTTAILNQQGITENKIHRLLAVEKHLLAETAVAPPKPKPRPAKIPYKFSISPVFLTILGMTLLAGLSAWFDWLAPGLSVFFFVTGGWVISLCLHEFGHAVTAYWAGDDTVEEKGYLTLDPLKYTHTMMSIILPLIIVMMGGIGLPGGAVYINRALIRHKYQHSLVSAAGPIATGIVGLLLAIPFFFNVWEFAHPTFWSAIAMLAFLQITALFFNLLPLPGLDGFGILAPYLPEDFLRLAYSFGQLTYILIFILFFYFEPFQVWFFGNVLGFTDFMGIERVFLASGFELFRFWLQ